MTPPPADPSAGVAFRHRCRGRRVLAALAATVLSAAVLAVVAPAPAQAQSANVLVSNTGVTTTSGGSSQFAAKRAQGFMTGSNADGYTLSSIGVFIHASGNTDSARLKAELWSASGANPSAKLADLTVPTLTATSNGVQTFTAPALTVLDASTRYFVVVYCSTNTVCADVGLVQADGEDANPAAGFSIDNTYHQQSGSSWSATGTSSLRISVNGAAYTIPEVPGLTVTPNAAGTSLRITWSTAAVDPVDSIVTMYWKGPGQDFTGSYFGDGDDVRNAWRFNSSPGAHFDLAVTPGNTYGIRVGILAPGNPGLKVAFSEFTVTPYPEVPGLTASSNADGTALTVNWNAVTGTNLYRLEWRSGEQGYTLTNRRLIAARLTTATITGLTPGTVYTVRVTAQDSSAAATARSETAALTRRAAVTRPSTGSPSTGTGAFKFLADSCELVALVADGTFNGRWDDDPDCGSAVTSRSVSRFYRVVLPAGQSTINFSLEGGGPRAKLRLWPEWTKSSVAIGDADDPMRARFLRSGAHYLEVEHGFKQGSSGSFRITMDGLGAGPAGLGCADTSWRFTGSGSVKGRWDAACVTPGDGRWLRVYELSLAEPRQVTLDVQSAEADTQLALLTGLLASEVVAFNDDYLGSRSRSQIAMVLDAGNYQIAVQSKQPGTGGTFTLDVDSAPLPPAEGCADTYRTVAGDVTVNGVWDHGCTNGQTPPTYRRYYDLLVRNRKQVTLTADSADADPFLSLSRVSYNSSGAASFTAVASNDDHGGSKSRSRIVRTLDAGRYRVEARAKNAETAGSFTLTVAGLGVDNVFSCAETYEKFTAPRTISSAWDHGCEGSRTPDQRPRHHRYFDLEVPRGGLKTIVLRSDAADPVLSLYRFAGDGSQYFVATNDNDGGSTSRSRIAQNLDAGRYRIYAAPKNPEATGAFTVEVTEGITVYGQWNHAGHVVRVPVSIGGNLKIAISSPAGYSTDLYFDRANNGGTESSVRRDAGGMRSDRDASLTVLRARAGANTIRARLHPEQLNHLGNFVPIASRGFSYPVEFTLNYNTFNSALWTPPGGQSDSAPSVSDKSLLAAHEATVGVPFSVVLPAADAASGNGGPYEYILWKRGAGVAFAENGLTFDAATRTLSGTPAAEATHLLAYQIHDNDPNRAKSDSFVEETDLQIVVSAPGVTGDEGPQADFKGFEPLPPPNTPPLFDLAVDTALTVAENSPAGTAVGAPIAATDPDEGDTLTYSLSGDDAALFDIDSDGQITTAPGASFDYEVRSYLPDPAYAFTVNVTDGAGSGASLPVTVTVTDVDDPVAFKHPPAFFEGLTATREIAEDSPAGTKLGAPFTAYDLNGDKLTYIGFDVSSGPFDYDPDTGQVTVAEGATLDRDTQSVYVLMLIVMEAETPLAQMTGITITITVTEATETRSDEQGQGGANGAVDDANSDGPSGQGEDTSNQDEGEAPSGDEPQQSNTEPANTAPSFDADVDTAPAVNENSPAGTAVGTPITATDPDAGDTLTYSLTGTNAASFSIDSTGQISTAAGVTLDYETKSSYALIVGVTDSGGLTDSVPVTVNVNNIAPTADAGADFDAKRGETDIALSGSGTAHAEGSQALTYEWAVSGASDSALTTVAAGFLTDADQATAGFTVPRKKNMPTDKRWALNDGNWIEFTLTVTDGDGETHTDTVKLTIQGTIWKAVT